MILIVVLKSDDDQSKLLQFGKVNKINEIHGLLMIFIRILMRFIVIHNKKKKVDGRLSFGMA